MSVDMDTITAIENVVDNANGGSNNKAFGDSNNRSDNIAEILNSSRGPASLSSQQEYEKRLLTFQASTYYAKPACLSPLFCARFGWQNADKDMLVCTSCSSALAIALNSKLSANSFDKLCRAYRNKIVCSHDTNCPFRLSTQQLQYLEAAEETNNAEGENDKSNIEKAFLTVPVYMGQVLPEESIRLIEHPTPSIVLRKQATQLSDAARSVSCAFNNGADKNTTSITAAGTSSSAPSWRYPRLQIPSKIRQINSSVELTKMLGCDDESILALSLLGWNPIPNITVNNSAPVVSLGCPLCLSIMELRLEQQQQQQEIENENEKDDEEDDDVSETSRSTKRQRLSSRHLNPLDAHRHYCPYKVGFPKEATDTNPIWKMILERLCKENQLGHNILHSSTVQETVTDVADEVLDESIDRVRRILRAGIAPKKIDLSV